MQLWVYFTNFPFNIIIVYLNLRIQQDKNDTKQLLQRIIEVLMGVFVFMILLI